MFGDRKRKKELLREAEEATDYRTWREAALALDHLEGKDAFKQQDESRHYDHHLIRDRLDQLRRLRAHDDHKELVFQLRQGLLRNLGNLANPLLYEQSRTGTKWLIDNYVGEVVAALNFITDTELDWFPLPEKLHFLQDTLQSFGRSALLLSGGANFGVFHIGVARALWGSGLLPRVFSGASTGAIIAGMLGTHTDDELPRLFELDDDLRLDAWAPLSPVQAVKTGGLFDQGRLEEVVRHNVGELTFLEAYQRTGRAINISVSASPTDHGAQLCNYLTTPHLLVWSAVMASCALPTAFPPYAMTVRRVDGTTEPYMGGRLWLDGSMRSDLPMRRLGELFNVNHHVVSQANPHIAPFLSEHEARPGVRRLVRDLTLGEAHHRTKQALALLQTAAPLEAAEQALLGLDAVFDQKYRGDITISPDTRLTRYFFLLKNLDRTQARELARAGEVATWKKMSMIRNQTKIGQTLERCVRRTKAALQAVALPAAAG